MRVGVLGPLVVTVEDGTVDVSGSRVRGLLARLALAAGKPVAAEALIDALWGAKPPETSSKALQTVVSRLRKALPDGAVESSGSGYRLAIGPGDVDAEEFERLVDAGRAQLRAGGYERSVATLDGALALWRADVPMTDLRDAPFAEVVTPRLQRLRHQAVVGRIEARFALGRHEETVGELDELVSLRPLDEHLACLSIRALAATGRQADALAVYERVRGALAEQLGVDPSAELTDMHLALLRGEIDEPIPARKAKPSRPRTRLTSFVGRDGELAELTARMTEARLVSVVGPGGAGKTRLVTEWLDTRPDGEPPAWFVELAPVREQSELAPTALAALGPSDRLSAEAVAMDVRRPSDRLADELAGSDGVLVLDNCEHVIAAAADLAAALLERCPGLRILTTTREPLAITGESLYSLGSLAVPEEGASAAEAMASPAVRLFADRARAARPGFTLVDGDGGGVSDVIEICRRLDGMPLALELAGARLRSMSPHQVAERLDDRFRLLTGGSRVALPRHRTLRAVVEWSWDLLEPAEAWVAARLSVFPGGATGAAAAHVCSGDGAAEGDVVYLLSSLVEKSFVEPVESADGRGDGRRYRMLETVRAYCAQRLESEGATEATMERFAVHQLDLAEHAQVTLRGGEQRHWMRVLSAESDNNFAALRWLINAERGEQAVRLGAALVWYWVRHGTENEGFPWITEVVALPGDEPRGQRAMLELLIAVFDETARADCPQVTEQVRGLVARCRDLDLVGEYPEMVLIESIVAARFGDLAAVRDSVSRALRGGDPWARAITMIIRAFLAQQFGELARAHWLAQRARSAFARVGDEWCRVVALGLLSELASVAGDHERALALLSDCLAAARDDGSASDQAGYLTRMASARIRLGQLSAARRDIDAAVALVRGSRAEDVVVVDCLRCELELAEGNLADASALARRLVSAPTPGIPPFSPLVRVRQVAARVAFAEGDLDAVAAHLVAALPGADVNSDRPEVAGLADVLAALHAERGRPRQAAWALGIGGRMRGALDGRGETVELQRRVRQALGERQYAVTVAGAMALPSTDALSALRTAIEQL